jgi:hypothetical protein
MLHSGLVRSNDEKGGPFTFIPSRDPLETGLSRPRKKGGKPLLSAGESNGALFYAALFLLLLGREFLRHGFLYLVRVNAVALAVLRRMSPSDLPPPL